MVNGNEWEERKMGRATEQEQDQQRAVRGGGKTLFFGFFFFFFLIPFLWTRISEYPHGRALVKVFSGGFLFSKERFGWTLFTQCNSSI